MSDLRQELREALWAVQRRGSLPTDLTDALLKTPWGLRMQMLETVATRLGELLLCSPDEDLIHHVEKAQQDEEATMRMLARAEADRNRLRGALEWTTEHLQRDGNLTHEGKVIYDRACAALDRTEVVR